MTEHISNDESTESLASRIEKLNPPPDSFNRWLITENPELEQQRPIDIIEGSDEEAMERLVGLIAKQRLAQT